jgi:Protein of unknown function (DUF3606)
VRRNISRTGRAFCPLRGLAALAVKRTGEKAEGRKITKPKSREESNGHFRLPENATAQVAGGQDYEVRYEAKKSGKSAAAVKKAKKKVGNSRKRVEKRLGR